MSQTCPKCQTVNVDEAKFCKSCGFNIQEAALKKSQEKQHSEDEIRRKNTERELDNYRKKTRNNATTSTNQSPQEEDRQDKTTGYIVLILIFVIIIIYNLMQSSDSNQVQQQAVEDIAQPVTGIDAAAPAVDVPTDAAYVDPAKLALDSSKDNQDSINLAKDPIKYYSEAIIHSPNEGYYYNERGQVYLKIGNIEKANKDARKACELGHCGLKEDMKKLEMGTKTTVKTSISPVDSTANISADGKTWIDGTEDWGDTSVFSGLGLGQKFMGHQQYTPAKETEEERLNNENLKLAKEQLYGK